MKILALCHDLPSPYTGASLPVFNLLKYLAKKHDITLVCFKQKTEESRYRYNLNELCEIVEPQTITVPKSLVKQIIVTTANTLSPINLFSTNPSFFNFYYSPRMQLRIKYLLSTREFDLIYSDSIMAFYGQNVDIPKIINESDCVTEISRQKYLSMKNLISKFLWWLEYQKIKRYERNMSNKYDIRIVISPQEQKAVQSLFPELKTLVIPNGVDSEYFRFEYDQEEYPPSLIFVGDMAYQPNIDAILYFYSRIYEEIKISLPETKLYIVGRNPTKEILSLSKDKSVIVTGYVEDVRPYLARASVVLAPFISGTTGIKNKVLEAMAMAKPVVSTSMGVQGITLASNEHVIVANNPDEFAKQVVKLLCNKQLRQNMGLNARRLVEFNYSWEKMAEQFDKVFAEVAGIKLKTRRSN